MQVVKMKTCPCITHVQWISPSSCEQNAGSARCNDEHAHQYTTDSGTSNHHRIDWGLVISSCRGSVGGGVCGGEGGEGRRGGGGVIYMAVE